MKTLKAFEAIGVGHVPHFEGVLAIDTAAQAVCVALVGRVDAVADATSLCGRFPLRNTTTEISSHNDCTGVRQIHSREAVSI